ncbi:MAG: hypothetical protein ACRBI6_23140 [Acidimicrobiales bacterium]
MALHYVERLDAVFATVSRVPLMLLIGATRLRPSSTAG